MVNWDNPLDHTERHGAEQWSTFCHVCEGIPGEFTQAAKIKANIATYKGKKYATV